MNSVFVAATPITGVHRLAFGLEVLDAARGGLADVIIASETVPTPYLPAPPGDVGAAGVDDPTLGLPKLSRGRRAGRFRQLFTPGLTPPVTVRIADLRRRYVPRRLVIPFAPLAAVLAEEVSGVRPATRTRRVSVFPGNGYGPHGGTTGLRGRVVDQTGEAVPWVRVTARHATADVVVGQAHGDDRGEFLLLLNPPNNLVAPQALAFTIRVAIWTPPEPLTGPLGTPADPLAGLVAEHLPPLGSPDTVSPSSEPPPCYTAALDTTAQLRLGRLVSPATPFTIP